MQLTQWERKWDRFMYRKQSNKTALQSQRLITDALLSLMEDIPFARITVTQICDRAGVGRKTFYRNFELKEDVITFRLDELCAVYEAGLLGIPLERRLRYHFTFLKEHAALLILLNRHGLRSMVNTKFSVFMPETMPRWSEDPVQQQYLSEYITAGIDAIMTRWIIRDFQESLDEILALAQRAQSGMHPIQ